MRLLAILHNLWAGISTREKYSHIDKTTFTLHALQTQQDVLQSITTEYSRRIKTLEDDLTQHTSTQALYVRETNNIVRELHKTVQALDTATTQLRGELEHYKTQALMMYNVLEKAGAFRNDALR